MCHIKAKLYTLSFFRSPSISAVVVCVFIRMKVRVGVVVWQWNGFLYFMSNRFNFLWFSLVWRVCVCIQWAMLRSAKSKDEIKSAKIQKLYKTETRKSEQRERERERKRERVNEKVWARMNRMNISLKWSSLNWNGSKICFELWGWQSFTRAIRYAIEGKVNVENQSDREWKYISIRRVMRTPKSTKQFLWWFTTMNP